METKTKKICAKCGEEKDVAEFGKNKKLKDGLHSYCLMCCNERVKQYYKDNIDKVLIYDRQRYKKDPEKQKRRCKKYRDNHPDFRLRVQKKWKLRYHNDINFRISTLCRNMVGSSLGKNKTNHSMRYFMCTQEEFKLHIEKQFEPWMNWSNRGWGPGKWQVDHIIPVWFFNMLDETEKYMCCRYQNLRPLAWEKNHAKGGEVPNVNP